MRTHLLFILILSTVVGLQGQQVYQSSDYGGPGTVYLYNRLTGVLPFEQVQQTGPEVTWDFSGFEELNTHPTQIVSPSQGIDQVTFLTVCALGGISFFECFDIWNQTEQALLLQDSLSLFGLTLVDLQRFQNKDNSRLLENFFGFTVEFGGTPTQAVVVYQSPDTVLQFPLNYLDAWSSHVNWGIDLTPAGQNLRYYSDQQRFAEVDSWGTLITPYDTFTNVIRLRSEIQHRDTLYTDSLNIPVNITQVEYTWYDTTYKLPIMVANGVETDTLELINVIEYIYEATCPEPEWTVSLPADTFYLDNNGDVTVDFTVENPNAGQYTWIFDDGNVETTNGSVSHEYNFQGDIAVSVTGCMTDCLPLNSCTTQVVDFVIVDLTSVPVIPGSELGIQLFPNPAKNDLTISFADFRKPLSYNIIDITGRRMQSGVITSDKNEIDIQTLQNGIYSIEFNITEPREVKALMRFAVSK